MFRSLDPALIAATAGTLRQRIAERFPDSGLTRVAGELLAVAPIAFLVTIESRLRRHRALKALHELRSLVHIVDMHQLTKDPDTTMRERSITASSPRRAMTPFELGRYLDYCSELLSVTSKVAALYAQQLEDPVVLNAVNEVEALTTGLSAKIRQKLVILGSATREIAARPASLGSPVPP